MITCRPFAILASLLLIYQQVTCGLLIFDEDPQLLACDLSETASGRPATDIAHECHLLKLYNQTLVEEMKFENMSAFRSLMDKCSCSLVSLGTQWESYYDTKPTRRVFLMVDRTIEQYASLKPQDSPLTSLPTSKLDSNIGWSTNEEYPVFLWSDIDITFYGISIHTATSDYFDKVFSRSRHFKLSRSLSKILNGHETWLLIMEVCSKISEDRHKLYRYMENLNRLSPVAFSRTLHKSQLIDMIYQASKVCKILLLPHLNSYKLKPDNSLLVSVSDHPLTVISEAPSKSEKEEWREDLENVQDADELINYREDLDVMLNSASSHLLNCREWQTRKSSLKELEVECPMMMSESSRSIPSEWITNHTSALSRSQTAIKCACQLLLHNSTWSTIMLDRNVQTMATALTNYLNENRIPDFSSAPIMTLFGWFQHVMARFQNRKMSIKEIMKVKYRDQDPTVVMKHDTYDESLELLRRGCNYIMFNYNKGSPEAVSELKLIRYLDNLQTISRDPMFVFHLSLQDPNLFKLNALSKMCKPIVS